MGYLRLQIQILLLQPIVLPKVRQNVQPDVRPILLRGNPPFLPLRPLNQVQPSRQQPSFLLPSFLLLPSFPLLAMRLLSSPFLPSPLPLPPLPKHLSLPPFSLQQPFPRQHFCLPPSTLPLHSPPPKISFCCSIVRIAKPVAVSID